MRHNFVYKEDSSKKGWTNSPFTPQTYLLSGSIYRFLCTGRYFQILCWKYVRQLFNFLKFCRLFSWGIIKHFSLHIFTTSASFYLTFTSSKLKSDGITLPNSKSKLEEFFFVQCIGYQRMYLLVFMWVMGNIIGYAAPFSRMLSATHRSICSPSHLSTTFDPSFIQTKWNAVKFWVASWI